MCFVCTLLDDTFGLPSAGELVSHVGEADISDEHKVIVYDKALEKADDLNLDVLKYTAELAGAIHRDLLRKT